MSAKDDDLNKDSSDSWWEDDSYELYIDGDNSKGQTYDGVNDQGFHWSYNETTILDPDPLGWETMGVVKTDYGIDLEVALPLENLGITPEPGYKFGIEVQWNEDDAGDGRDAKVKFFATVDEAWQNPSYMGTAELEAGTVHAELAVHQTYAAPTIDGEMEELWYNFPEISSNNYPKVSGGISMLEGGGLNASYLRWINYLALNLTMTMIMMRAIETPKQSILQPFMIAGRIRVRWEQLNWSARLVRMPKKMSLSSMNIVYVRIIRIHLIRQQPSNSPYPRTSRSN